MIDTRTARVLVVDDETDFRKMVVQLLSMSGFDCTEASNGPEALELLGGGSYEVGLFDILMPGMTGKELASRTRELYPDTKLIAMSALECTPEVMDSGFDAALQKPFDIKQLVEMCERLSTS